MELEARIAEFGPTAYLVTVRPEGRPHLVATRVSWDDGEVVTSAGDRTTANVGEHADVTLLWAAPLGGGYCLILDGRALVAEAGGAPCLRVRPSRAVLHRMPDADQAAPSCITVL